MNKDSAASMAVGLVVGVAIGSILAFILTPYEGQKTRQLIKEKFDDVGGLIKETTGNRKKIYAETWQQPKVKPYSDEIS